MGSKNRPQPQDAVTLGWRLVCNPHQSQHRLAEAGCRVSGWKEGAEGDAAGGLLEMEMARSGLLRAILNPRTYIRPAD
jgi:hypothetical protein